MIILVSTSTEMVEQTNTNLLISILAEVCEEQGFGKDVKVIYKNGSENGDGYSSANKTVILKDNQKSIDLFIKLVQKNIKPSMRFMFGLFETECSTYQNILPALIKFQKERNIKDPFNNYAKCFKIAKNEFIYAIVLENIHTKGFRMHDRLTRMDKDHVLYAFRTYARLHAVSFAIKDQEPNLFEQIRRKHHDTLPDVLKYSGFLAGMLNGIKHYASIHKGGFGKKCMAIYDKTIQLIDNIGNRDEYEVITHGDSWSNNILFGYEDGTKLADIRLVDFQLARFASPVYDLSYFFYVVANEEMLEKLSFYQDYYYAELSKRIQELGSDPDVVFPKAIFTEHWKKYGLYGFSVGVYVIKIVLFERSEVPSAEDLYKKSGELVTAKIQNEDKYVRRINALFKHFVEYLSI